MDSTDLARDLRDRLLQSQWDIGDELPSTAKLRRLYRSATLRDVQQALALLRDEGVIENRHGLGHVVVRRPIDIPHRGAGTSGPERPAPPALERPGTDPVPTRCSTRRWRCSGRPRRTSTVAGSA